MNVADAVRQLLFLAMVTIMCSTAAASGTGSLQPFELARSGVADLEAAAESYHQAHGDGAAQLESDVRQFLDNFADVEVAARLILASHWKTASPQQRQEFTRAFDRHVTSLLVDLVPGVDFASVSIEPLPEEPVDSPLLIKATFLTSDQKLIHFVLVVHEREGRWRIMDVIAEGISYVKLYRTQFGREVTDLGMDAMIRRFESRIGEGSVLGE